MPRSSAPGTKWPRSAPTRRAASRPRARAASLHAIVGGTERATQSILQAAEEIDQAANTLSASVKGGHDQGLAHDIQDRVVQIFEACNFQDLTGQRVAHVMATLKFVEEHVARLMAIWHGIEQFKPVVFGEEADGDRRSSTARSSPATAAIPPRTTSTACSAAPEFRIGGRRIAAKQASATTAKPAASASAVASEARSATKAITSGAADCITSQKPLMRPISRP